MYLLLFLVSIELQLQDLGPVIRSGVYSHLEAFVPCNKETLVKRLKKLHLNVQVRRGIIITASGVLEPVKRLVSVCCFCILIAL